MNWSNKWNSVIGVDYAKPGSEQIIFNWFHGNKQYHAKVDVVGDLALDYDDDGWNIFHVPTLTLFSKAVPGYSMSTLVEGQTINNIYEYEKDQLLNWMKKVQENYPTSWTMLRCLTPEDYEDKGKSAKDIILKWCLSVKVE